MISKHLSGHLYHNSPYESDDSCGTCNGGKCESCREYWTVEGMDRLFVSYADAQDAINNPVVEHTITRKHRVIVEWGALPKTHKQWGASMHNCDEVHTVDLGIIDVSYNVDDMGAWVCTKPILLQSMSLLPDNFAVNKETLYGIDVAGRHVAGGGFDIWRDDNGSTRGKFKHID